ncbi:MAG: ABC transporter permease [Clostridia bacterium]|nr:ABC transporter permease [Clostridia bacterium]
MTLSALLGAVELGTIYAVLALGIFLSFRTLNMPDLTVDGSIVTGMATSAMLCTAGVNPYISLIGALITGGCAGLLTGILHTKFKIQAILAGILVMLGSYSINLRIMGKTPNVPLVNSDTIYSMADKIMPARYSGIVIGVVLLAVVIALLYMFLNTRLGFVFRATGDNEDMVRASGVSADSMKVLGLALSNGLVGLSGGMLAQNQGFADISSGTGMMVIGLASVILGEVVFGTSTLLRRLVAASLGAVLYRIIISQALYLGMESSDLKLVSAVIVAAALYLGVLGERGARIRRRKGQNGKAASNS